MEILLRPITSGSARTPVLNRANLTAILEEARILLSRTWRRPAYYMASCAYREGLA
jgi:hypothetical protein